MEERLIVISSDSHAGIPKELWPEYLDPQFHEFIANLHEDNEIYPVAMAMLSARVQGQAPLPEHREAHSTGWHGLHDAVLRMADMDREGVAAEFVFHGDSRLGDLFHNVNNRTYPFEVWEAGAHAWNRWAADNFGFALDRFLLCAAVGPCVDMDAAVAEIHWLADHRFTATYGPHYMTHPGLPPLHDEYWDPYWAACAERNIAVVVHAGFGTEQGTVFNVIEDIYGAAAEAAGSTDRDEMLAHADAVRQESADFFTWWVNRNVESRRPLWQLTLGGVFDRHPALRLMLTEIRLDWIPATLDFLDGVFEEHRDRCPPVASRASTGTRTAWPVRRSCTRWRSTVATRSASTRSSSVVTTRTPRARGRTPASGCRRRSSACPRTRCGRCWARTPSASPVSIASAWPRSPGGSDRRSRTSPGRTRRSVRS